MHVSGAGEATICLFAFFLVMFSTWGGRGGGGEIKFLIYNSSQYSL